MNGEWQTSTLGETCEMYQPKTITGKELVENGLYPVYGANGIIGRYNQFNHEEPQLLITCRGATCGAVNVSSPKAWITGNAMVVRPKQGNISLRYLEYLFRGGVDISLAITGAAQPQITRTNLAPLKITFPTSTVEQQRIVAILDEAFEGITTAKANTEKNLRNARECAESALDAAIRGESTAKWRQQHPQIDPAANLLLQILARRGGRRGGKAEYVNPEAAQTKGLPPIPHTWVYATVEQLLRDDSGLAYGILKPGDHDAAGVPMIRVMDIGRGRMSDTEIFKVTPKLSNEFKRTILEEDDIMLAVMATVGRCAIVPPRLVGANVNRALAVLKLAKGVSVKYILHAILSPRIQSLFQKNKVGAAQARINLSELRGYAIPLPPLVEQHEIVRRIDDMNAEVEHLESLYQQKLAALEALKKSLLHQAFTGQLTMNNG